MGIFTPKTVSIGDLFVGAIIPGLILVLMYILYVILFCKPALQAEPELHVGQPPGNKLSRAMRNLLPPVFLIVAVLGSILTGAATPTEAAGVGAFGATVLAGLRGQLSITRLREVAQSTTEVTSMVFLILIGAAIFSLVFRGFGGEEIIEHFFKDLPGGLFAATLLVMLVIFLLGFILDFIEITFVVVPIVGPVLLAMGLDPVWLGVMIAINLQTSFLTPPFGFALFYLRGVAPPTVETSDMYRGVMPFIAMQVLLMLMLSIWPQLATWLPELIYN
jgi:tripartite ATP-independent transporter DctM subunit